MKKRTMVRNISVSLVTALLLSTIGTSLMAQDTEAMIETAMQNMQRIMMMPQADRMSYVMKAQEDSVDRGEALFDDGTLGTNGQACASCHVGGATTGGEV